VKLFSPTVLVTMTPKRFASREITKRSIGEEVKETAISFTNICRHSTIYRK